MPPEANINENYGRQQNRNFAGQVYNKDTYVPKAQTVADELKGQILAGESILIVGVKGNGHNMIPFNPVSGESFGSTSKTRAVKTGMNAVRLIQAQQDMETSSPAWCSLRPYRRFATAPCITGTTNVMKKDSKGIYQTGQVETPLKITDEGGRLVTARDENGNAQFQKDSNGKNKLSPGSFNVFHVSDFQQDFSNSFPAEKVDKGAQHAATAALKVLDKEDCSLEKQTKMAVLATAYGVDYQPGKSGFKKITQGQKEMLAGEIHFESPQKLGRDRTPDEISAYYVTRIRESFKEAVEMMPTINKEAEKKEKKAFSLLQAHEAEQSKAAAVQE
jgi:hypothetical protein